MSETPVPAFTPLPTSPYPYPVSGLANSISNVLQGPGSSISATSGFQTYGTNSIIYVAVSWSAASGSYAVSSISFAGVTFHRLTGASATTPNICGLEIWWGVLAAPTGSAVPFTINLTPALSSTGAVGFCATEFTNVTTPSAPFDPNSSLPAVLAQAAPGTLTFTTSYPSVLTHPFTAGHRAPNSIIYIAAALMGPSYDCYIVSASGFGATNTAGSLTPGWTDAVYFYIGTGGVCPSIDGQIAFMQETGGTIPPPSPPSLALDSLLVTGPTVEPTDTRIFLDWSDDRGHSYRIPVGQNIGQPGAYLTALQWQRLGYGRDRVFRLTWSAPVATALQGAWVQILGTGKT